MAPRGGRDLPRGNLKGHRLQPIGRRAPDPPGAAGSFGFGGRFLAANKRKILENARKLAQKGARAKALAEYERLVKLEPRDAKLRLEIGDTYRRWGQVDEAIETYEKVAEQYTKEGFDARAVAVYKQILNLEPDRHDAYEPLAELYERMGLTAEAIGALQTAADGHHRQGRKREALELLRKMAVIDPANTTSRVKVAELLRHEGMTDQAVAEYEQVAQELGRQGDVEAAAKLYRRVLELEPGRASAIAQFARTLLELGKTDEAESLAKRALGADEDEPAHYELLADVYRAQGRESALAEVYRPLAELYRRRGDEDKARAIQQRFVPPDTISPDSDAASSGGDVVFLDGAGPDSGAEFGEPMATLEDELSASELTFRRELAPELELGPELEIGRVDPNAGEEDLLEIDEPAPSPAAPAARRPAPKTPSGDPDQLLAEASVYLRYGNRDKALAHLEAILDQEPDHRQALEKLGETFAESDEPERAVGFWMRAAKAARQEGDDEAITLLAARIERLDPAAAASLLPSAAVKAVTQPPLEVSAATRSPAPSGSLEDDLDLDLDLDGDADLEIDDDPIAPEPPAVGVSVESRPSDASLSSATAQKVREDLEEADFYVDQGLLDEAEAIYKQVLAIAPNHPRALVRLGEVTAARGASPDAAGEAHAEHEFDVSGEIDLEPDDLSLRSEVELDDVDPLGVDPDSDPDPEPEADPEPDPEPVQSAPAVPEEDTGEFAIPTESPAEPAPRETAAAGEGFDLAAALSDVFESDDDDLSGRSETTDDGFEAVFDAFKRGVSETLSEGDHEAHYDLGIAYKEMGLLDDAIQEFRAAMVHPPRVVECLHLIGLCSLDAERADLAVEHLEQLLETSGANAEQQLAARFDLGRAYAEQGRRDDARAAFEQVLAIRPDYLDTARRLAALGAPPAEADAPADAPAFESFEDFLTEVGVEGEPEATEAGPAARQPVSERSTPVAERAAPAEEPDATPVAGIPTSAPDDEPDPPAPPSIPASPRSKKKISFL